MFQIDEKVISDNRTLISIQGQKAQIDPLLKNGTINYTMTDNNLWLTTPKIRDTYLKKGDITQKFDRILLARDGTSIDGSFEFMDPIIFKDNVEIKKDLMVRGNLTVEGEYSVIDTPSLSIEDNIIELNRNEEGSGISLRKAGFAINRGSKEFVRSLYDEDNKAFIFDTCSTMDGEVGSKKWIFMAYNEANGEYQAGEVRARYRFSAPFGKFSDSLSVANQTTLNTLTVNGNANLNGATTTNNMTINGQLTVNNNSVFNGAIVGNRIASFKDNVVIDKALSVGTTASFGELATFNKGIKINSNGANINGPVSITGTLNVSENTTLSKDLSVAANINTTNLTSKTKVKTLDLEVTRDAYIDRNTIMSGTLTTNGQSTLNGGLLVKNNFTVESLANFDNHVVVRNKNVSINSNSDENGKLLVGGHTVINRTLTVKGNTTIDGSLNLKGYLDMSSSNLTAANITTKNNYSIEAGDGKGIRFWNSDNYRIYMSSSNSEYGGRLDTISDYNMYFKMAGGESRGFIFKNDSTLLGQLDGYGVLRIKGDIYSNNSIVLKRENEGHKSNVASGINADRVDDLHASSFLRRDVDTDTSHNIFFNVNDKGIRFNEGGAIYKNGAVTIQTANAVTHGMNVVSEGNMVLFTIKDHPVNGLLYKDKTVWHSGNHGHGSNLDADKLDGKHANYFATADHLHDDRYIKNNEVDLKEKYKIMYNENFDSLDIMYMG